MRLVKNSAVLFMGSLVSLGLVACGGDDGGDDVETIDPTGTDNTFVISKISTPNTANEATGLYGLDIDEKENDGNDNQLGTLLASIRTIAPGLNIQASLDEQVDSGSILLLANVKAKELTNTGGVGLWVYQGDTDTAMPLPCTDLNDTTCRKHLSGSGTFTLAAGAQTDARLSGKIMGGTFKGGPGTVTLQLALSAGAPIELPLQKAKAEITVTANGFGAGSKIGGAIAEADIDGKVYPAILTTVGESITRDCPTPGPGPDCVCVMGSSGASILSFLDTDMNCVVTLAEIKTTVDGLLTKDIDLDNNGQNDAVSLGVGVAAVKGMFPVPAFVP